MSQPIPSLGYLHYPKSYIEDKDDFYRSGIKEASRLRNLVTLCQRLFITSSKGVNLYLVGEKDIYCIELIDKDQLVCKLYYLPKDSRLDIYDGANPWEPIFMWKSKKCVYKNIPVIMERVKAESLFSPLLSAL